MDKVPQAKRCKYAFGIQKGCQKKLKIQWDLPNNIKEEKKGIGLDLGFI